MSRVTRTRPSCTQLASHFVHARTVSSKLFAPGMTVTICWSAPANGCTATVTVRITVYSQGQHWPIGQSASSCMHPIAVLLVHIHKVHLPTKYQCSYNGSWFLYQHTGTASICTSGSGMLHVLQIDPSLLCMFFLRP